MKTLVTQGLTLTLVTFVLASSQLTSRAEECKKECKKEKMSSEAATAYKVTDVAVVRPVAGALTLAGGALWLITWPITAASGDCDHTYTTLVKKPASIAFDRKEGHNDTPAKETKILKSPRSM